MTAISENTGMEEKMTMATAGRKRVPVHSQVRRIWEEEQRIGEIAGERRCRMALLHPSSHVEAILCTRSSILPSSPLGRAIDPYFR